MVDSGASKHFSCRIQDFESIKRWNTLKTVRLTDSIGIEAIGYGTVVIETTVETIKLSEVWYTPNLASRLISVSALNDKGISVLLKNRRLIAYQRSQDLPLFEGTVRNSLYQVDQPVQQAMTTATGNTDSTTDDTYELWHQRTGHASCRRIEQLPDCTEGVQHFRKKEQAGESACEACLAGRMKETFNKTTDNCAQVKIRRLHTDISGIKAKSIRGYRYFLLVVDDATRYSWVALL